MLSPYSFIRSLIAATILLAIGQQTMAGQSTPNTDLSTTDRFLMLVPERDTADIQRDIDSAEQDQAIASEAEKVALEQRSKAAAKIEEKKQSILTNKNLTALGLVHTTAPLFL
jgi:hypothetical protein